MGRLNLTIENVIEITWMFDALMEHGKIESWDNLIEQNYCSLEVKLTIQKLAEEFEDQYGSIDWEETDLDYISEISKFSEKRLIEEFGKEHE